MKPRNLRIESLERRLTLSGVWNPPPPPTGLPPVYIQPPEAVGPIELPPFGALPPGTTQLSPPAPGNLPPGMSPFSGGAETTAVDTAIAFQTAHPTAVATVTDKIGAKSFSVTVTETSGADFYAYTVTETAKRVVVNFFEHDTTGDTIVAAVDLPLTQNGGLVYLQADQGVATSLQVVTEVKGVETAYTYPASSPALSEIHPAALDKVVKDNLVGAPPATLANFKADLADLVRAEAGGRLV